MYACMHVRRRGQEFEKKQGQGSRGELEEGKGMEGNDPGEERSIPDAGERQTSLLSFKAIGYINGFVKNTKDGCFLLKRKSEMQENCGV